MKSQHSTKAIKRLNTILTRLAVRLEQSNSDRDYDRLLARVQDSMNERAS